MSKTIRKPKTMAELEADYIEYVNASQMHALDLSCWMPSLGSKVRPLVPGELAVIMADTGHCKTACAQNIAVNTPSGLEVLFFELELPGTLCFERFCAMYTKTPQRDIEDGYRRKRKCQAAITLENIRVQDQAGLTCAEMTGIIRECGDINIVVVDYVGLVGATGTRSRYERVSEVAEQLKVMAKETNTVVLATTQVHRKGDQYPDELYIHDAKDSGSIENSAGVLLGVWKDSKDTKQLHIKILKNTKGEAGDIIDCEVDWPSLRIREDLTGITPEEPEEFRA